MNAEEQVKQWLTDTATQARNASYVYVEKVKDKIYKLNEKPQSLKSMLKEAAQKQSKLLSKKRRIKKLPLSTFKLSKDAKVSLEDAQKMNHLWKEYAFSVLQPLSHHVDGEEFQSQLSKLDFHGAYIKVVQSACQWQIGMEGYILQDLSNCFKILSSSSSVSCNAPSDPTFSLQEPTSANFKAEGFLKDGGVDNLTADICSENNLQTEALATDSITGVFPESNPKTEYLAVSSQPQAYAQVKTIGKHRCVFQLQLPPLDGASQEKYSVLLFGSQLKGRASDRAAKRLITPSQLNV